MALVTPSEKGDARQGKQTNQYHSIPHQKVHVPLCNTLHENTRQSREPREKAVSVRVPPVRKKWSDTSNVRVRSKVEYIAKRGFYHRYNEKYLNITL